MERGHLMSETYPLCAYYVRSTSSRATTRNDAATNQQSSTLSRCSSLGSSNSAVRVVGGGGDDQDWFYGESETACWYDYFSFRRSNSCCWIGLKLTWRILLSLGVVLLLFYLATKPPTPQISIQVGRMHFFRLTEGADAHGVPTKMLTCNCSVDVMIENHSRFFGLHVRSPSLDMSFGRLHFAISEGPEIYAESNGLKLFKLYVGTRNRPVYGAGHNMQDLLLSRHGLPLMVRARLVSEFRVVWDLIKPRFHHQALCSMVLSYGQRHRAVRTRHTQCKMLPY